MNAPNMKDVARRAGVSLGTVSNVLNRPELVKDKTREKVELAISELGFIRNESARQLRAGHSRVIAYLVLDQGNPFFTDLARGVEEVARAHNFGLFLCNTDNDVAREDDYLSLLIEQRVRGLLITPADQDNPRLAKLPALGIPVVLVDRPKQRGATYCSVGVDDRQGGLLAVTHLLEQGHERIAFVGGSEKIRQVADRLAGARRSIRVAGVSQDALAVVATEALTVADGRQAGSRLLGLPARRRPTAIFCANDLLALGILQEMTARGVAVPEDMAIVGYDDIEFASAAAVPLTSVRQPRLDLGRTAARLLIEEDLLGSEHKHQQVQFEPELIVRASTLNRSSGRSRD